MKMLEKSTRLGITALLVGVLAAVGLVVAVLYAQPADATYPGKPGKIAYMSYNENDDPDSARWEIYTIWPGGGGKVQLTNDSTPDNFTNLYPSYSPNGKRIAYQRYDGNDQEMEIYTIKASGGGKFNVTDNKRDDFYPSYSPSGKRIAFIHDPGKVDNEIYTIKTDGSGMHQVTDDSVGNLAPTWGSR